MALSATLFVMTACSPACTPPDAKAPSGADAGGSRVPDRDPDGGSEPAKQLDPGEMIMEAKGVDLAKLSESQRSTFFQIINTEPSACGEAHSLAKSLRDDSSCRDSLTVSQFVADRLKGGATPSVIKAELEFVTDSLRPRKIDIKGRPTYGSERAPVTVVVFADFECPHCRAEAPKLRAAVDQFRGRAKLVFKHFPLGVHKQARRAAIACEAAHAQGKFWEMHDLVFQNQQNLSDDRYRVFAKQIGLDLAKFDAAFGSKAAAAAVDRDRADGDKLDIEGTPAVYFDGRFYNELLFGGHFAGWIDDALKR